MKEIKIKMLQNYTHKENKNDYLIRNVYKAMERENSDFYYIYRNKGNDFDLIPKNICQIVK